jgi:hypothetical protein
MLTGKFAPPLEPAVRRRSLIKETLRRFKHLVLKTGANVAPVKAHTQLSTLPTGKAHAHQHPHEISGLAAMQAWGFTYKTNIVWHKIRRDGGSDGRGVGFYFRNVTELILFGVRGKNARTLDPGRSQAG